MEAAIDFDGSSFKLASLTGDLGGGKVTGLDRRLHLAEAAARIVALALIGAQDQKTLNGTAQRRCHVHRKRLLMGR